MMNENIIEAGEWFWDNGRWYELVKNCEERKLFQDEALKAARTKNPDFAFYFFKLQLAEKRILAEYSDYEKACLMAGQKPESLSAVLEIVFDEAMERLKLLQA